jgi:hypothetical protein
VERGAGGIDGQGRLQAPERLQPGEWAEYVAPLEKSNETQISRPFRISVQFWHPAPFFRERIAAWFGRGAKPRPDVMWSEVVTP